MTKTLSNAYRQKLLDSSAPDLTSVNLKIVALDSSYTYDAAHDFLNDVTGVIQTSGNLASKTITNGTLGAADINIGSPAAGDTITQFWLYYDTGSSATSLLIYYWDEQGSGAPVSIATDGSALTISWNAPGIFRV